MTDSVPTTSNLPSDEQLEMRNKSAADVRGFRDRKFSHRLSEMPEAKAPVDQDADNYKMDHPNRGTCLVFNHATYDDKETKQRYGSFADVRRIGKTFGDLLGFTVDVCNDYTCEDIKKKIKKLSEQKHTDNDCLCIIVLSHGNDNNRIYARDYRYSLSTLWEPFTADNCVTLAGKPKLFFVSACRGDKRDKGVKMHLVHSGSEARRTETDGSSSYVIPVEADFLFGFSTPPGYASFRCEEKGTWYIQCLCDVLDEYATTTDLVDILTKTANKMTKLTSYHDEDHTMDNKKQVPEFHSRLLRRVHFTPKQGAIIRDLMLEPKTVTSEQSISKPAGTATSGEAVVKPKTVTAHSKKPMLHRCNII